MFLWSALKTRDSFLVESGRTCRTQQLIRTEPDMPSRDALLRCFGERGLNGRSDRRRRRARMTGPSADRRRRSGPNGSRRSRLRRGRRSRECHTGDGCCARGCARSVRAGHHRRAGSLSSARFSRMDAGGRTNFPNQCRRYDSAGRSVAWNNAAASGQGNPAALAAGSCLLPLGSIRRHSRRSRPG